MGQRTSLPLQINNSQNTSRDIVYSLSHTSILAKAISCIIIASYIVYTSLSEHTSPCVLSSTGYRFSLRTEPVAGSPGDILCREHTNNSRDPQRPSLQFHADIIIISCGSALINYVCACAQCVLIIKIIMMRLSCGQ